MRKNVFLALIAIMVIFVSCDDEKIVSYSDLPKQSQTFLETHFQSVEIGSVIKDRDDGRNTWEVKLTNGWEIDFRRNGEWNYIDCHSSSIPESIFMLMTETTKIWNYCGENYPNTHIVEIDKESFGYDIELSNGTELRFNSRDDFSRID